MFEFEIEVESKNVEEEHKKLEEKKFQIDKFHCSNPKSFL